MSLGSEKSVHCICPYFKQIKRLTEEKNVWTFCQDKIVCNSLKRASLKQGSKNVLLSVPSSRSPQRRTFSGRYMYMLCTVVFNKHTVFWIRWKTWPPWWAGMRDKPKNSWKGNYDKDWVTLHSKAGKFVQLQSKQFSSREKETFDQHITAIFCNNFEGTNLVKFYQDMLLVLQVLIDMR